MGGAAYQMMARAAGLRPGSILEFSDALDVRNPPAHQRDRGGEGIRRGRQVGVGFHHQPGARRGAEIAADWYCRGRRDRDPLVGPEVGLAGDPEQLTLGHAALDADVSAKLEPPVRPRLRRGALRAGPRLRFFLPPLSLFQALALAADGVALGALGRWSRFARALVDHGDRDTLRRLHVGVVNDAVLVDPAVNLRRHRRGGENQDGKHKSAHTPPTIRRAPDAGCNQMYLPRRAIVLPGLMWAVDGITTTASSYGVFHTWSPSLATVVR